MKTIIYHNPRCSKSRATLALLAERNLDLEVIEYLKETPTLATLRSLLVALGGNIQSMVRSTEPVFTELNLKGATEERLLQAIAEHPVLLERPIVVHGTRVVVGRPPENVLTLFD